MYVIKGKTDFSSLWNKNIMQWEKGVAQLHHQLSSVESQVYHAQAGKKTHQPNSLYIARAS